MDSRRLSHTSHPRHPDALAKLTISVKSIRVTANEESLQQTRRELEMLHRAANPHIVSFFGFQALPVRVLVCARVRVVHGCV